MLGGNVRSFLQPALPLLPLILPLVGHFILASFVLLYVGSAIEIDEYIYSWVPPAMIFSHIFFFITGIWTLRDRESTFPVLVFIFVALVTFFVDLIEIRVYYKPFEEENGDGDTAVERTWKFSAGMMIINFIGKPITIALACIAIFFRTGASIPGLNFGGGYQSVPEER